MREASLLVQRGTFPGLCSSLFDFFDRREKARFNPHPNPSHSAVRCRYNKCSTRFNQHSPPVADVTERRYDHRKLGQKWTHAWPFYSFGRALYCRIKAADQVFLKGGCVAFLAVYRWIRTRNAGLACLLSLPGPESNPFWKRMME